MNNKNGNISFYIYPGIFFLLTFGFFSLAANYVLYFQETQHLFIFSDDYLRQYLQRPGAPLEYIARFLTQFYASRIAGSLIVAIVLTLPAVILYRINKRTSADNSFSVVLALIPGFLLLIMQANYYHMMEYNLGYIVVLLCYLLQTSGWKYSSLLIIILFPLLFYLTGGYAFVFMALYIIHAFTNTEGRNKFIFPLLILLTAGASFLVFWKLIFLQPVQLFVLSPLPLLENRSYIAVFIVLTLYIICYPAVFNFTGRMKLNFAKKKLYPVISLAFVFLLTVFALSRVYNPQNARVIELEKLVFREKWDKAIQLHEKKPSRNLIGQYFYNIALSETGQLCDRLFKGNQNFLAGSLVLPWGDIHLDRGGYFYYSIGLINEAHRWAYEEMVVYGYRPQNIRMLAKTSLITGDYEMAHKYLNILKRTLFYRKWAKEFEKLANNPSLIASHPELGEKVKLLPPNNFFIQFNEPQNNLPFMLEGNPLNKKAIEYYLAGLLLTKKVEIAVNNVKDLRASGYDHIPRHLEEAILIYYNSMKDFPDLGGLTINRETLARFDQYFAAYVSARQYPDDVFKEKMREQFEDTFWYYFHFE
jgi:hypothetical protein